MFKRIVLEDWMHLFPKIGLIILFAVFLLVLVRVLTMKKKRIDHIASLPLEQEKTSDEKRNPR